MLRKCSLFNVTVEYLQKIMIPPWLNTCSIGFDDAWTRNILSSSGHMMSRASSQALTSDVCEAIDSICSTYATSLTLCLQTLKFDCQWVCLVDLLQCSQEQLEIETEGRDRD